MQTVEQVGAWFDALASAEPAPGGGAAASLSAAMGASLVSMVCRLTIGRPKYAEYEDKMKAVLEASETARRRAYALADEDARAFRAVIDGYKLPRGTDEERAHRRSHIRSCLVAAAGVPVRTAALSAEIIGLCREIAEGANRSVLSDVAVAAIAARGALAASIVNVDVNLASIRSEPHRAEIRRSLEPHVGAMALADQVVRATRERIGG